MDVRLVTMGLIQNAFPFVRIGNPNHMPRERVRTIDRQLRLKLSPFLFGIKRLIAQVVRTLHRRKCLRRPVALQVRMPTGQARHLPISVFVRPGRRLTL